MLCLSYFIKVVSPLTWLCWEGGCALIALCEVRVVPLQLWVAAPWLVGAEVLSPNTWLCWAELLSFETKVETALAPGTVGPCWECGFDGVWITFRVILCLSWIIVFMLNLCCSLVDSKKCDSLLSFLLLSVFFTSHWDGWFGLWLILILIFSAKGWFATP